MAFFDWYEPRNVVVCPLCGVRLSEFQGTDGPSALFVWREGVPAPIDQRAGDVNATEEDQGKARLPARFVICSYACSCGPLELVGFAEDGVWVRTAPHDAATAQIRPSESRREYPKRVQLLEARAGRAGRQSRSAPVDDDA